MKIIYQKKEGANGTYYTATTSVYGDTDYDPAPISEDYQRRSYTSWEFSAGAFDPTKKGAKKRLIKDLRLFANDLNKLIGE
jgi:hypothetical protein